MAKLYLDAESNILSTLDSNEVINDTTVGSGNWCIVDDAVWIAAQHYSDNTLVGGVFTAGRTLSDYKLEVNTLYDEKLVLPLTIDTRQITNTSSEYMEITAAAMSAAANIMWQLADGTFHTYTNAEFTALWEKINEYRQSLISNKDALVTALDAAPDPSTIDLDTGWPTTTYTT